jgi:hypothetical protein
MLILDVKTQWSSMHQMMRKCVNTTCHGILIITVDWAGRALDFKAVVDDFVSLHKDLHALELSDTEWDAIGQVANWLKLFRAATTEMSRTKEPMLLSTHVIFCGLQEHLCKIICKLPPTTHPKIKDGLLAAHRKLSDYYYRFDQSPFYTWAASTY